MNDSIFQSLPLQRTRVWQGNPRKTVRGVDELAVSIRDKGVRVPVLARRVAGDPSVDFEIVAGQRRYLAAGVASLTEIPAIVREVDDDEALELGLLENSARADVDPLEEAEAIERLVRDHGRSVADVAARLGRSVRWVEKRRSLLRLTPESRAWCASLVAPLAHMESLSAVGTEAQARVIERLRYVEASRDLPSHHSFARIVAEELHDLGTAPFDLDAELGGRGPCGTCPMRSDRQQSLFEAAPPGARCLDDACWQGKVDALWERAKRRKLQVLDLADVGRDWNPGRLDVNWDSPWLTEAPTPNAKPVALTRGALGHVYELYARPEEKSAPKAETGEAAHERYARLASEREAADAARAVEQTERVTRVFALTGDPATTEAFLRCALRGAADDYGLLTLRRAAQAAGLEMPSDEDEIAVVEAVPVAMLWRVLLTSLCCVQLGDLAADGEGAAAPWERDLLARLAVPAAPAVRVWISEAAWDALPTDEREGLEEPVGGAPLPWEGRKGWVTTTVPDELLSTVRGLAEAAGVTLQEGDEVPAREALPASVRCEVFVEDPESEHAAAKRLAVRGKWCVLVRRVGERYALDSAHATEAEATTAWTLAGTSFGVCSVLKVTPSRSVQGSYGGAHGAYAVEGSWTVVASTDSHQWHRWVCADEATAQTILGGTSSAVPGLVVASLFGPDGERVLRSVEAPVDDAPTSAAVIAEGDEALYAGLPLVTLRVKRSVWQQHRSGLQDSAKGVLHKVWQPEGEDRFALCARGGDAHTKVMGYAKQHGLDVRVGVE